MLSLPIEKEIKHENTVLSIGMMSLNMRQTVCLVIGAVIAIAMYLAFRDWILMVVFTLPYAALLLFIAKPNENGRKTEEVLLDKAEEKIYKNKSRKYRTKNCYVKLMNRKYARLRNADHQDKSIEKMMKKEAKALEKRKKASKIRGIA